MCGAPGAPRFSPREGKACRSGSLEGTGIPSLCRRVRRTGKPRPDAESAKVRACPGALREHAGFQRKTCRQSAGAPCAGLGTPGTGGPVWGVPASALGPRLTGLRAPAHPRRWPRFGGGKETGRFFLDGKKKKKSGQWFPGSPSPLVLSSLPSRFCPRNPLPLPESPRQERCPGGGGRAERPRNLRRVTF